MASKTRKKPSDAPAPAAPASPPAPAATTPTPPMPPAGEPSAPAAPASEAIAGHAEAIAAKTIRLKETLEQLRAEGDEQAAQAIEGAVTEALRPTPPSQLQRLRYEATYGQALDGLRMRHVQPRSGAVGVWLATQRDELKVTVREDVVFPVAIGGKPTALDQVVTLLNRHDQTELAEGLVADLKRYHESKVAKSVIFAFATEHVRQLEAAEAFAAALHLEE